jgi:hypothetical protein
LSPSLRQSGAMMRKVKQVFHAAGAPIKVESETTLQLRLVNGSVCVGLPNKEESIRGISATALFFEEAARIPDALFQAALPFLATVPNAKLVALSTPFGRRGWLFHEWHEGENWTRINVDVRDCVRISPLFLEEQKRRMGPVVYAREFENSFEAAESSVFRFEAVEKCIRDYESLDGLLDSVLDVDASEDKGDVDEIGDLIYGDIFEDSRKEEG